MNDQVIYTYDSPSLSKINEKVFAGRKTYNSTQLNLYQVKKKISLSLSSLIIYNKTKQNTNSRYR